MEFEYEIGQEDDNGLMIDLEPEVQTPAVDPVVDTPATDPVVTPTNEPVVSPTGQDWVKNINEAFGVSYETPEALKNDLDDYARLKAEKPLKDEYEALQAKHVALVDKFKEVQGKSDPKGFFGSDEEFKAAIFRKENPSISGEVVSKVFSLDVAKANPIDLIVADMMLKHTRIEGGEAGARALFLSNVGLDEDFVAEDLTLAQKNAINVAAEDAANHILSIRNGIALPNSSQVDIDSILSEIKPTPEYDITTWGDGVDKMISNIKTFEVKDGDSVLYAEPVDEEFKAGLKDVVVDVIKQKRIDPTPENIKAVESELMAAYFLQHSSSIFKRFANSLELKFADRQHADIHNDKDLDKVVPVPPSAGRTTNIAKVLGLE